MRLACAHAPMPVDLVTHLESVVTIGLHAIQSAYEAVRPTVTAAARS
jgi:hypothetical protein